MTPAKTPFALNYYRTIAREGPGKEHDMKTISLVTFWTVPLAFCLVGCAHQQPEPTYSSLPPLERTSDRSADRVYTTTVTAPGGGTGSITYGSKGDNTDAQLAEAVRRMVLADPKLAPYPSKVTATADPTSKGKIILSGMVPSRSVKKNLVEHVRQVPGVTEVEDNLTLDLPKKPRESDSSR